MIHTKPKAWPKPKAYKDMTCPVGALPSIKSAYKYRYGHVKYLRDSSNGLQIQILPLR
jgi:hypothetical protein